jgi:hypothetical protein
MLNLARLAVLLALALNVKRGLAIPLPPESDHEWMALITCMTLGLLEAAAFVALGSRTRGATLFVYLLGGLGLAAAITHSPMLVHMIRDHEPFGFFALALVEGTALALGALFKWLHERGVGPRPAFR